MKPTTGLLHGNSSPLAKSSHCKQMSTSDSLTIWSARRQFDNSATSIRTSYSVTEFESSAKWPLPCAKSVVFSAMSVVVLDPEILKKSLNSIAMR